MTSRYTKKLYKLFFNITTTKKLKNKQNPILPGNKQNPIFSNRPRYWEREQVPTTQIFLGKRRFSVPILNFGQLKIIFSKPKFYHFIRLILYYLFQCSNNKFICTKKKKMQLGN